MTDITGDVRPTRVSNSHVRFGKITALNDAFCKSSAGGIPAVTSGIKALGLDALIEIVRTIRAADDFIVDNDPYGEHDMGSFMHAGERIFWKIDYYDVNLEYASPDPADPAVTTRVLTVMLASEY